MECGIGILLMLFELVFGFLYMHGEAGVELAGITLMGLLIGVLFSINVNTWIH